jgi:hypothetical protein
MERPVIRYELEPLQKVRVFYAPDTRTLSIHNGLTTSDGEEIAEGLTVFYDRDGTPAGFVLESAELLLKPFLDAVRAKELAADDAERKSKAV